MVIELFISGFPHQLTSQAFCLVACTFHLLLQSVTFDFIPGLSNQNFEFLPNGDGPPRYRILNFRQPTPGKYEWVTIGMFENKQLTVSIFVGVFMFSWMPERKQRMLSRACVRIHLVYILYA